MKKKAQGGFTLVEVLVALFLVGLLLVFFLSLYDWHGKVFKYEQARVLVTQSSRSISQALVSYGSQAYHVAPAVTIAGITYNSGASTVILQIPSIDASGNPLTAKFDYVVFFQDASSLYLLVEPDLSSSRSALLKQLSSTLSSINFTYNDVNFSNVSNFTVDALNSSLVRGFVFSDRLKQTVFLKNFY